MEFLFKKVHLAALFGSTVLLFSTVLQAETAYVTDTLRVGIRPAPDNQTAPIGVVKTGMQFKVLETIDGFVRIKTDSDLEGWIRDSYVVKDPPAMIKLEALQQQQGTLAIQLKGLEQVGYV